MAETISLREQFHENVERLSKSLPFVLLALYVFGFLVVMRYLSGFGVSSFDLFKVQYLVSGAWACLPFLLIYIIQFASNLQYFIREGSDPQNWKIRHTLLAYLFGIFAYVSAYYLIFYLMSAVGLGNLRELWESVEHNWKLVVRLIGTAILVRMTFFYAYFSYLRARDPNQNQRTRAFHDGLSPFLFSVGLILGVLYLTFFATGFYPLIPHSLGGGRPLPAVFILDCSAPCKGSALQLDGDGPKTIPYQLLLERENSVTVISADPLQHSIQVKRSEIKAILVLKNAAVGRVP